MARRASREVACCPCLLQSTIRMARLYGASERSVATSRAPVGQARSTRTAMGRCPALDSAPVAKPVVCVVAGALFDRDHRVLIAQRPHGKHMAGRWEFPGGKVAAAETESQALVRELREELGIAVIDRKSTRLNSSHTVIS